jgi:probable rRNA maturation factor
VVDHELDVQAVVDCAFWEGREEGLARALHAAAKAEAIHGAVALLLTDDAAMARLNHDWLGKHGPTNVLSFPAAANAQGHLGDIALGAQTVAAEARADGKSIEAHAAHLVVHGFLHLLGYDHMSDPDADAMEAREREILAGLGLADPYAAHA